MPPTASPFWRRPPAEPARKPVATVPRFYFSPNACSLGVHIAFEEVGAPYQAIAVRVSEGEQKLPAFLEINPMARVPAALIDGRLLTECGAVLTYLALRHPEAGLLPLGDPYLAAKATEWISWFASTVHISFAQIWRSERFTGDPTLTAGLAADAPERIKAHFRHIEAQLSAAGPWLLGEHFSIIDPYALVFHRWGSKLGMDMSAFPAWAGHAARLYRRPAVMRALEIEGLLPIPDQGRRQSSAGNRSSQLSASTSPAPPRSDRRDRDRGTDASDRQSLADHYRQYTEWSGASSDNPDDNPRPDRTPGPARSL